MSWTKSISGRCFPVLRKTVCKRSPRNVFTGSLEKAARPVESLVHEGTCVPRLIGCVESEQLAVGCVPLHGATGSDAVPASDGVQVSIHLQQTDSCAGAAQWGYFYTPDIRVWVVPEGEGEEWLLLVQLDSRDGILVVFGPCHI